ncbi:Co-chaperone GrpE family protein [Striga hermonthica]|uniref:GrpE protein homolog n=1 Tax=Striga hermonthica TaxID=68872 RepID=A0A9N7MPP6_STRHE|nr:Co-chaperone GrpE family protein [Striga hermonthica]
MATTVLKTTPAFCAPAAYAGASSVKSVASTRVSFSSNRFPVIRCRIYSTGYKRSTSSVKLPSRSAAKFLTFAADGETAEAQTEIREKDPVQESEDEETADGTIDDDSSIESEDSVPDESSSLVIASLNLYKEALANNDDSKITEVESLLKTIEDEKIHLESKVAQLTEELSYESSRVLRISADFDNFRKRTEGQRRSLISNAQGEVVESLLPVLDNFERAKAQIKVETEGEEKVNNSYQSIYKQFVEILGSLGVVPVESVGRQFDPMLHEAIMREDSTEYEDGVVIEEYRKGFQLGERLLRPSMVKVSAGPGPTKPENGGEEEPQEEANENNDQEGSPETEAA